MYAKEKGTQSPNVRPKAEENTRHMIRIKAVGNSGTKGGTKDSHTERGMAKEASEEVRMGMEVARHHGEKEAKAVRSWT